MTDDAIPLENGRTSPADPTYGRLLRSNLWDAVSGRFFTATFAIVAVLHLGFSATQIGLLNFAGSITFVLFAVPLGAWVDRHGGARVLGIVYVAKLAVLLGAVALYASHLLNIVTSVVLVLAMGLLSVASENAQTTTSASLATQNSQISTLISRMAAADEAAGIVVPGLVGLLVARVGGGVLFSVAAAFAALATCQFLPVRTRRATQTTGGASAGGSGAAPHEGHGSMWAGFRVIRNDRFLLLTIVVVAVGNVGLAIGDSVEAILVLRHLHLGAPFYGLTMTVAAVAGLAATVVGPRIVEAVAAPTVFRWGGMAQALVAALPLLALLEPAISKPVLLTFSVAWSLILFITNVSGYAYLAGSVERSVLGRTAAARRAATMGLVPFAAFLGGFLADVGGIGLPLVIWPVITLLGALAFFVLGPRGPQRTSPAGLA